MQRTALTATGDIVLGAATVTNLSNITGLSVGATIKVAGCTFGASSVDYATVVNVGSTNTTVSLDSTSNNTVVGAALAGTYTTKNKWRWNDIIREGIRGGQHRMGREIIKLRNLIYVHCHNSALPGPVPVSLSFIHQI